MKNLICHRKMPALILFALTALAACTTSTQSVQQQATNQGMTEAVDETATTVLPAQLGAIDYYSWVVAAEPEKLQLEQSRLEREISITAGKHSMVQLAVVISARSSDTKQQQRALALLDEYNKQQSATLTDDYDALAHLWRQALEPRLQSHELRQKIDALTSIEQQLGSREQQGG